MNYSVAIRTLGTAGDYYQRTLDSIASQTIQPDAVMVFIAQGYELPKETIGTERYVYVKKGMVAQRALQYDEIESEFILFLDDDVYLPPDAVEVLFRELADYGGDVIAPSTFANHKVSLKSKIRLTLSGKEVCRPFGQKWGYKVLDTAGFSYNNNPVKPVYRSQTNAGPCFLCRKKDFAGIHYEDELWLDDSPYSLPDDQVMFYKMHLSGLRVLTSFDSGIVHLDAGSTIRNTDDRMNRLVYSEARNKLIFWYKFMYLQIHSLLGKVLSVICICYFYTTQLLKYLLTSISGAPDTRKAFVRGLKDARRYISDHR